MKRFALILISLSALCFGSVSCDDVLNIDPTTKFKQEDIWGDQEAIDHYLYSFYSYLRDYCETTNSNAASFSDCYSDIMKSGSWNQYGHGYNTTILQDNSFTSDNAGAFECWGGDYSNIRYINQFLYDIEAVRPTFGDEFVNVRSAEARFVRAYVYWHLIRIYGGVPLRIVEADGFDGPDQNDKARSSEEDCWKFVMNELKEAAGYLPQVWKDQRGRVTKAAAYGFLSRVAVYAHDWQTATDAAEQCKLAGGSLDASYSAVFSNATSPENLLLIEYASSKLTHRAEMFFRPVGDAKYHNNVSIYGVIGPTSELVDSYEMADGTPFSWEEHGNDPYAGREPRFYSSILYDGASWEGRDVETCVSKNVHQRFYEKYGTAEQTLVSERDTVLLGEDHMDPFTATNSTAATPTGYYFKKFITENSSDWETNGSTHFGFIIRYAEVLLNAAEAYAEMGQMVEALECLNQVRRRVSLPDRATMDKAEFMEYLRHERMVELAGEGFRYWDVRRWRLGEELFNGTVAHGVEIVRNEENDYNSESGTEMASNVTKRSYKQVGVDANRVRYFFERYYYFAIPLTERSNNALINENNPGW